MVMGPGGTHAWLSGGGEGWWGMCVGGVSRVGRHGRGSCQPLSSWGRRRRSTAAASTAASSEALAARERCRRRYRHLCNLPRSSQIMQADRSKCRYWRPASSQKNEQLRGVSEARQRGIQKKGSREGVRQRCGVPCPFSGASELPAGRWRKCQGKFKRRAFTACAQASKEQSELPAGRWRKVQGKIRRQAHT